MPDSTATPADPGSDSAAPRQRRASRQSPSADSAAAPAAAPAAMPAAMPAGDRRRNGKGKTTSPHSPRTSRALACGGELPRRLGGPRLWRRAALAALERIGTLSGAAQAAGVHRRTLQRTADRDESFRAQLQAAVEVYTDSLEELADERAFRGVDDPVFQGGVHVGDRKIYSDRLAELRLKRLRPAEYRETPAAGQGATVQLVLNVGIPRPDLDPVPMAARRQPLTINASPLQTHQDAQGGAREATPCLPPSLASTSAPRPSSGPSAPARRAEEATGRGAASGSAPRAGVGPLCYMQAPPCSCATRSRRRSRNRFWW